MDKNGMTSHARLDRGERIIKIANTIGIGDIVKYRWNERHMAYTCLTDTGVIISKRNPSDNSVITIYAATYQQAKWVYGDETMPRWLGNIVTKNVKQHKELYM